MTAGLPPVEPIPDENHIARHCQPQGLDEAQRLPTAKAFLRKPTERSMSVGWLEYLKGVDLGDCISRFRKTLSSQRVVRQSHRLAVLRVGIVRKALRKEPNIEIKHDPKDGYHSHAGICGCEIGDLRVAVLLKDLVQVGDVHPGLEAPLAAG